MSISTGFKHWGQENFCTSILQNTVHLSIYLSICLYVCLYVRLGELGPGPHSLTQSDLFFLPPPLSLPLPYIASLDELSISCPPNLFHIFMHTIISISSLSMYVIMVIGQTIRNILNAFIINNTFIRNGTELVLAQLILAGNSNRNKNMEGRVSVVSKATLKFFSICEKGNEHLLM